jgi:ABC-type bacteriocin/lantibiotic exporter with double-glycine peptidase domain
LIRNLSLDAKFDDQLPLRRRRVLRDGTRRMASVDVVNVRKSYGGADVIHGVSISIADGEFVILVGPSGCGNPPSCA